MSDQQNPNPWGNPNQSPPPYGQQPSPSEYGSAPPPYGQQPYGVPQQPYGQPQQPGYGYQQPYAPQAYIQPQPVYSAPMPPRSNAATIVLAFIAAGIGALLGLTYVGAGVSTASYFATFYTYGNFGGFFVVLGIIIFGLCALGIFGAFLSNKSPGGGGAMLIVAGIFGFIPGFFVFWLISGPLFIIAGAVALSRRAPTQVIYPPQYPAYGAPPVYPQQQGYYPPQSNPPQQPPYPPQ